MQGDVGSLLAAWGNFFVITGTASATLIGLMFVVITLVSSIRLRLVGGAADVFNTPTVVHFSAALFISATLSAPWRALTPIALLLGLTGLMGIAYVIIVLLRTRHLTSYKLVLEDWLWHVVFPFIAYAIIAVAGLLLTGNAVLALFFVGAVTVLLLFSGIHNAWDTVTYLAIEYAQEEEES